MDTYASLCCEAATEIESLRGKLELILQLEGFLMGTYASLCCEAATEVKTLRDKLEPILQLENWEKNSYFLDTLTELEALLEETANQFTRRSPLAEKLESS